MKVNFDEKGLIPAIIQDDKTKQVLMLGYMNQEALDISLKEKRVCFFSRSKSRLWVKGETSGNFLIIKDLSMDCDQDALLVKVEPVGDVCHKGSHSCWGEPRIRGGLAFLADLEKIIQSRLREKPNGSYVSKLASKGINKIAQKVGEEAVELVIESKDDNDKLFVNEAADLLFHKMILLNSRGVTIEEVVEELRMRNKA